MQYRWVGKKIDLALLKERIEGFFRSRGFRVEPEKLSEGFGFSVGPVDAPKSIGALVEVIGKSDDFLIEFETERGSLTFRVLSSLTALVGGGGLLLRDLKSEEKLKELERDFWAYIGEWLAFVS